MTAPTPLRAGSAPRVQDLVLAVGVAVLTFVGFDITVGDDLGLALLDEDGGSILARPTTVVEALVGSLPLTFRRAAPVLVYAVVAAVSLATQGLNRRPEPLPLSLLVALCTVAVMRRPVVSVLAAAAYVGALTAAAATGWGGETDDQLYVNLVVVVGTVTLGYGIALSRARARLAEQRAADVARTAETWTREAVEHEKARIAREMHDILAHHLSVIVAQAAAARQVFADRPQVAADALSSIDAVGRDALSAVRRLLGLLRVDRTGPDRSPQPGLDQLDPLLAQLRRAGLPVDLEVRGVRRPLPADVELSAFRIAQEALTNTLKHAGPTHAAVTLTYGEDALDVEVQDEGGQGRPGPVVPAGNRGGEGSAGGYGLIGMQQRATMLGGQLVAGPHRGGFRVAARLPIGADLDLGSRGGSG